MPTFYRENENTMRKTSYSALKTSYDMQQDPYDPTVYGLATDNSQSIRYPTVYPFD